MSIPYRKPARTSSDQCAAYILILRSTSETATVTRYLGGLLVMDVRGAPLEFVYNSLVAPSGFLWPEVLVRNMATSSLCHSLFEACREDPSLLVCTADLGDTSFLKSELSVSIPLAQVVQPIDDSTPLEWNWINDPPSAGMAAFSLGEMLRNCGFAIEPFDRIELGLMEVYPEAFSAE